MILNKVINKIISIILISSKKISLRKINVYIHRSAKIDLNTIFEGDSKINDGCILVNCFVGRGTFISSNSIFYHARIGRYCSIAPDIKCIIGNHPTKDFVSTHPAFFSLKKQAGFTFCDTQKFEDFKYVDEKTQRMFEIGNDVWIGQDSKLLNGIKIGNGAIIAAGSLVINDVPNYAIVGGIPAKIIKMRFSLEQIAILESFKWWEKPNSWLKENSKAFEDIEIFKNFNFITPSIRE